MKLRFSRTNEASFSTLWDKDIVEEEKDGLAAITKSPTAAEVQRQKEKLEVSDSSLESLSDEDEAFAQQRTETKAKGESKQVQKLNNTITAHLANIKEEKVLKNITAGTEVKKVANAVVDAMEAVVGAEQGEEKKSEEDADTMAGERSEFEADVKQAKYHA